MSRLLDYYFFGRKADFSLLSRLKFLSCRGDQSICECLNKGEVAGVWKWILKFIGRLEAVDTVPDTGELGQIPLWCEKLLLPECCLSAAFPYRLHRIRSANIEEPSDPAGELEES